MHTYNVLVGPPRWPSGKEPSWQAGDVDSIPRLGRYPGEEMATNSSILAWEPHGQILVGSPRGHKELDTTHQLNNRNNKHDIFTMYTVEYIVVQWCKNCAAQNQEVGQAICTAAYAHVSAGAVWRWVSFSMSHKDTYRFPWGRGGWRKKSIFELQPENSQIAKWYDWLQRGGKSWGCLLVFNLCTFSKLLKISWTMCLKCLWLIQ